MPSKWFKRTNCKILHSRFSDFFRQSVTKIMGKTAIRAISCFSPLLPLNNVEKQWAKLESSYVMGLQHCVGGEGGFLNRLFKIPMIFYHWLSKNYKKKKKDEILSMLFQITLIMLLISLIIPHYTLSRT